MYNTFDHISLQNAKLLNRVNDVLINMGAKPIKIPVYNSYFVRDKNGDKREIKNTHYKDKYTYKLEMSPTINSLLPSRELFSLIPEIIRPVNEAFIARDCFSVDRSGHPGTESVGYRIAVERSQAKQKARGQSKGVNNLVDVDFVDQVQRTRKLTASVEITRDDMLKAQALSEKNFTAAINIFKEKLVFARMEVERQFEHLIFHGDSDSNINGFLSNFGTTPTNVQGYRLDLANADRWNVSTSTNGRKIENIQSLRSFIARPAGVNSFQPNVLILSSAAMISAGFAVYENTGDGRTVLTVLKQIFKDAFNTDLIVKGYEGFDSNNTGITGGVLALFDNNSRNFQTSITQDITLLNPSRDAEETTTQVIEMRTGGFFTKQPKAAAISGNLTNES